MSHDLLLIDGSSYLYRAFHALPPLSTSRGEPTGAVYGVVSMLRKLLTEQPTPYVAVVFDAKGKTFRDELYSEYKIQRPPMADELKAQIEPLHALIRAMGLPLLQIEGVEADDVLATLAYQAKQQGLKTLISTSDKDLAQLVDSHITLVNTMSGTVLDRSGVIKKFGVTPEQIIDYLALVGDSSDNIPGVAGVGPKTAAKWLQAYNTLDRLLEKSAEIPGKVGENLRAHTPDIPLFRELLTVRNTVPLPLSVEQLKQKTPENDTLLELFQHWEFKNWLTELLKNKEGESSKAALEKGDYEIILDKSQLERWCEALSKANCIAVDTETTSLDSMTAELVGLSFAIEVGKAAYVPVAHTYQGAPVQLERETVLDLLKPLLENPDLKKVGHHLKYDHNVLANYDITLRGMTFDTMLESYCLDSTASRHDMDTLALKHLNYRTLSFETLAGKGAKQKTFDQIPIEQAGPYAAEDADVTLRLHQIFWPRLCETPDIKRVFEEIEMPLVSVLARMERQGVLIDAAALKQRSRWLGERIAVLETQAHQLAGQTFNLGSPKQLQAILFEQLKLPVSEKTPTGQPSTSESVLQELAIHFELPRLLLEHRTLSKLKSTYTDQLPKQINLKTGRVHTSYHQAAVGTGRLSSSNPNLQNIPIRTEEGRRIRQAFIAPPGYCLISADYSQIELRLMAHFARDAHLIRAFQQGEDIHRLTASEVLGIPLEAVTDEQRRSAKAINFGLIYGMSSFGLARQLGIDNAAAKAYMERYFARYPTIHDYMEKTRTQAHQQGYVETLCGRRLYLPEIHSRNMQRKRAAERAAINAPLQGTAADIIKRAMIQLDTKLHGSHLDARLIMQVHDELVLEVEESVVEPVKRLTATCMEHAVELVVPLVVEIGVGQNWGEAH